jgi:hypothetical protein
MPALVLQVLALLLARPAPAHLRNTRGKPLAAAAAATRDHDSDSDRGVDSEDADDSDYADGGQMFKHWRSQKGKRQRKAAPAAAAAGAANLATAAGGDVWPASGKWAGGSLVVAPPAILQQWVSGKSSCAVLCCGSVLCKVHQAWPGGAGWHGVLEVAIAVAFKGD